MDVNNQLIGVEILSLAEADVLSEDLVFHKFYTNKMSLTTKSKKKKSADEEAAEELFDIDDGEVDGGDESANEEIKNMLDSTDPSFWDGAKDGNKNLPSPFRDGDVGKRDFGRRGGEGGKQKP
ncbi:uncharacterized protein HKW66_Vig0179330 [Vigna angularis]|uniref:Uncharacterized protein n=1 Tax=Phaseolus angularis TaxID=3914 RepID=A0A8T0JYI3_PHAAN|nr:uncharacterized protein HKW66_Vig0179330 [Vigna angularis]